MKNNMMDDKKPKDKKPKDKKPKDKRPKENKPKDKNPKEKEMKKKTILSRVEDITQMENGLLWAYFITSVSLASLSFLSQLFPIELSTECVWLNNAVQVLWMEILRENLFIFLAALVSSVMLLISYPRKIRMSVFNATNEVTRTMLDNMKFTKEDPLSIELYEEMFETVQKYYSEENKQNSYKLFDVLSEYIKLESGKLISNSIEELFKKTTLEKGINIMNEINSGNVGFPELSNKASEILNPNIGEIIGQILSEIISDPSKLYGASEDYSLEINYEDEKWKMIIKSNIIDKMMAEVSFEKSGNTFKRLKRLNDSKMNALGEITIDDEGNFCYLEYELYVEFCGRKDIKLKDYIWNKEQYETQQ